MVFQNPVFFFFMLLLPFNGLINWVLVILLVLDRRDCEQHTRGNVHYYVNHSFQQLISFNRKDL